MSMTQTQTSPATAPADLDAFWDAIDAELAAIPAAPESEANALHSTEYSTTYRVKLTSIGPYRIEVFLSIPDGEGPFPAIMLAPGYGSVVTPPSYDDRMRYVAMSIRYRGTRHADKPYAAKFPGLLTDGIEDPYALEIPGHPCRHAACLRVPGGIADGRQGPDRDQRQRRRGDRGGTTHRA